MFKKEKHKISMILQSKVINVQGICTEITVKYCESQDKIVALHVPYVLIGCDCHIAPQFYIQCGQIACHWKLVTHLCTFYSFDNFFMDIFRKSVYLNADI